jgi:hypothetical protein
VAHKFAEMQMMTETARLHTFHVADMLDAGENLVMETAIAKTLATEYNLAVADMGMQVMGGAGYMKGPMARLYTDARGRTYRRRHVGDNAQCDCKAGVELKYPITLRRVQGGDIFLM